ncbi:hypothetical protein [Hymenobacter terricola]|uniref:hypothetical protein n=1 Tax=Hymenobacter terricola TaxID=2819236 RepID=UPI001B30D35B|nr:hypothetical protein [Hymenobacter terricola]
MNKYLLSAALLLGIATTSQAGRLQGVTMTGAPAITIMGGFAQALPLQADVVITNSSGRSLRLGLQRQIRSEVVGTENNFCFGVNCYPPTVTTAPSPITLADASTDNSMVLDYTPNNLPGITVIRYALYEVGTQDSTYLTVTFNATQRALATTASKAPESVLSQPWPNPAAAGTTSELRYQLPANSRGAHLVLISMADGRRVRDLVLPVTLADGLISFRTDGLAAGIYSCLLLSGADGRGELLAARRLQVQ